MLNTLVYYSESHKEIFKYTLEKNVDFIHNIYIKKELQQFGTGVYNQEGFKESMKTKISNILKYLNKVSVGGYLLYIDCDVMFLQNPEDYMLDYINLNHDVIFQNALNGDFNAGFMLIKNTSKAKELFQKTLDLMNDDCMKLADDQDTINFIMENKMVEDLKVSCFDNKISHYGLISGGKHWERKTSESFELPNNFIAFHACYCLGIENKMDLLREVDFINKTNF